MRFILSIFALFLLIATPNIVAGQGKTCHMKELDLCMTNFFYDQKGFPTNDKEFKKSCISFRTFSKCFFSYVKRCSKDALRETIKAFFGSILSPYEALCSKPAGDPARTEIYKHAKCLNANQSQISTCRDRSKNTVLYLIDSDYDKQIPIFCCNVQSIAECTLNKTTEICGKETAEFSKKYNSLLEDFIEICDHFDPNGPTCEGMVPPESYISKVDPKSALYRMINVVL